MIITNLFKIKKFCYFYVGKFQQDAEQLLKELGGKENIAAVTHCVTRMRFVLNDDSKANVPAIEDLSSVKGTFTNAGQFQVIIGNEVPDFYNDFSAISGIEGVSKEASKSVAKQNQNIAQRLIGVLAEIFTPLLPAIIVGGLMLGFRNFLEGVPLDMLGGQTITESSVFGMVSTVSCGYPVKRFSTSYQLELRGQSPVKWEPHKF